MAEPSPAVVAFDFDGTLTIRDSFTAFLAWRAGPWRYGLGCLRLTPALLSYLVHRDRGRLKAAAAAVFLKGVARERLEAGASAFAAATFEAMIRPDALAAWTDWGERGERRVIVTASPTAVVAPFAQRLGADELIGTELAYDTAGKVTGAFATPNCRGIEKVVRLRARFGDQVRLVAAYGDTSGDVEMLAIADKPGYKVFKAKP
jgi:phosphatidylglycerophosphatase C